MAINILFAIKGKGDAWQENFTKKLDKKCKFRIRTANYDLHEYEEYKFTL